MLIINKEANDISGVSSIIKHACVSWFENNDIVLDGKFRDVKLANKAVKLNYKNAVNPINQDIKELSREMDFNETSVSINPSMSDDELLK